MMQFCRVAVFLLGLSFLFNDGVFAQVFPADFARVLVTNGLANPTAMAFAPDGRIFVAEQAGKLRVIKNSTLLPTAFVQLSVNFSGERGLIGIALDPDFSTNNYVYLYYTVPTAPIHNRISRFTANGDVVLPASESIVLDLDPLSAATNHNGGAMHFGKDGKLYVAIGENANSANAQNLDTYHGKVLRINKDGSVPDGNPYPTGSAQRRRVWAHGLRNPYTFSVHPESGRILVNDVGQVTWEEINDATTGGQNFGWPATEGTFNPATYPNFTNPIYAYPHGSGDGKGCAITGGTFFYPTVTNYPSTYWGKYFFQDLCNQWINTLDLSANPAVRFPYATTTGGNNLALAVGTDGNLYYLSRSSSALYKVIYNKTTTPFITSHPASLTVAEGEAAFFTVSALGTTPFTYQWQKDGVNIPGETNPVLTLNNVAPADGGDYGVTVTNSAGNTTSNVATLTVIMNTLPIAEIVKPGSGTTYVAGTSIDFSGTGSDNEDGVLPVTSIRWQVNFHHDTHKHDEPPLEGVSSGSFLIPNEGETSDNVWYRIILTVTDSKGGTGKDSVDILPRKSTITLTTNPPGLEVTVDGQPFSTPVVVTSVEGILRTFGTQSPQIKDNGEYEFESWSNGGDVTQTLATPADDLQLTANFSTVVGAEQVAASNKHVVLYPNPTGEEVVNIKISLKQPENLSIQLVNFLSQEIASSKQNLSSGEHTIPFHFGKQSEGIYSVIIKTSSKRLSRKLVITE
jgi:glucose/arabinose dehydrogenase